MYQKFYIYVMHDNGCWYAIRKILVFVMILFQMIIQYSYNHISNEYFLSFKEKYSLKMIYCNEYNMHYKQARLNFSNLKKNALIWLSYFLFWTIIQNIRSIDSVSPVIKMSVLYIGLPHQNVNVYCMAYDTCFK